MFNVRNIYNGYKARRGHKEDSLIIGRLNVFFIIQTASLWNYLTKLQKYTCVAIFHVTCCFVKNFVTMPRIIATLLNPFHATDLLWYHLKTSDYNRLSDVFRGYQNRPMPWNGLNEASSNYQRKLSTFRLSM